MNREQLQELACLHALGALTPEEARAFEEQLRRDPELQKLCRELQDVTAGLARNVTAAAPSPQLKERILAATAGSARENIVPLPQTRDERKPAFTWIPWALAASFAILAGALWFNSNIGPQPGVQVAMLAPPPTDASSKASGVSLWDAAKKEGTLVVQNLAPVPAGKDYQLWVIEKGKAPVDAGVFSVDEKGTAHIRFKPKAEVAAAATFAITLERKGGVPAPEGTMMLVGNVL
jgi:anti-sigma-K factor RskA